MELYNPNDFPIDLTGWELRKKTSTDTATSTGTPLVDDADFYGVIPARGFFLLAHPSAYTGSPIPDLRWSGVSYYLTDSNTLLLYDSSGTLIDKVGFDKYGRTQDIENTGCPWEIRPAFAPLRDGASISRVTNTAGEPQDTDCNYNDFGRLDYPTPRSSRSSIRPANLNIQQPADNPFLANVSWYFDGNDILTVEFDWLGVPQGNYTNNTIHYVRLALNTTFATWPITNPSPPVPYWISDVSGTLGTVQTELVGVIDHASPNSGVIGSYPIPATEKAIALRKGIPGEQFNFPIHVIAKVTHLDRGRQENVVPSHFQPSGLTRRTITSMLGRELGTGDFITLAIAQKRPSGAPAPDNTRFFGSGLTEDSETPAPPPPPQLKPIQHLRWTANQYGDFIEFDYSSYPFLATSTSNLCQAVAFFRNTDPPHTLVGDEPIFGGIELGAAAVPRLGVDYNGFYPYGDLRLFPTQDALTGDSYKNPCRQHPHRAFDWNEMPHIKDPGSGPPWHWRIGAIRAGGKPGDYLTIGYYAMTSTRRECGLWCAILPVFSLYGIDTTRYPFEPYQPPEQ